MKVGPGNPPKEHRFSKENQPPNENKRVPKMKTRLKKYVEEHLDEMIEAIIDQAKKGNVTAFDKLLDRVYGRVTEKIESTNKNYNIDNMSEEDINKELERLEKLEKQNDTKAD